MGESRRSLKKASVEVLLIVTGVLIALGVEAWIGSLRDAQLEQDYLDAIHADLTDDLQRLDAVLRELDTRDEAAEHLRDVLAGSHSAPMDTTHFLRSLDRAGYYGVFRPRRAALDDLIGSGNLRMLSNMELRQLLLRYHENAGTREPYDDWARDLIWNAFRPERGHYSFVLRPGQRGVEADLGEIRLDELAADPVFRQGLSNVEGLVAWQRDRYQEIQGRIQDLIARVEAEGGGVTPTS